MIAQRPENQAEILRIVDEIYSQLEPIQEEEDIMNDEQNNPKNETDKWFIGSSEKDSIKSSSPFTKIFLYIEKGGGSLDRNSLNRNLLDRTTLHRNINI